MTTARTPRFSVVVPALDEAESIGRCLRSLRAQEVDGGVEIIVADNNSIDDTAAIARSLGATVVHAPLPGVCHARQRGTEVARGEIVVSADADTTYPSGWLAAIGMHLDAHAGHVAVGGPCRFVGAPRWAAVYTTVLFGTVWLVQRLTGHTLYVTATNVAFRRSAFDGYDVTATQGGDELGLLRRLRRHGRVGFELGHASRTSSRRLDRGFLHTVLVTCVFYYLIGYTVNRWTGRRVVGTAPAVRVAATPVARRLTAPIAVAAIATATLLELLWR